MIGQSIAVQESSDQPANVGIPIQWSVPMPSCSCLPAIRESWSHRRKVNLGSSIACLERAALKHSEDKHHGIPHAAFMLAMDLRKAGQFRRAEAVLDNAVREGHGRGADMAATVVRAGMRYAEGRFADAAALAADSISLAGSGQPPMRFSQQG